jgi:hypothetical protein
VLKASDRLLFTAHLTSLVKLDSLAGIVDTDAPGLVPLKKSVGIKKKNLTLEDLPHDIRSQFNSKFKPKFLQQLESQPAWTGIDSWKDVAPIWDKVFPKYPLAKYRDLRAVVVKLVHTTYFCGAIMTLLLSD